jgi:broad specificity phosphatase PhoE
MRRLYLVRHASPAIQPNVASEQWTLSDRGIEEARALARIASTWDLAAVYSSVEPKAQATALIIGDAAGQPVRVVDGLHELRFDRWISNADAFAEMVRGIFEQPAVSVHGAERAGAAADRFAAAVRIVEEGPFPAAIVSHGRVLTAYLAQACGLDDPFAVWRAIPMPGWACLDLDAPVPKLIVPFSGLGDAP